MPKSRLVGGIRIQEPPELEAVRKSLSKTLGSVVSFSIDVAAQGHRYYVQGGSGEEVRAPGRVYPAILFYVHEPIRFWLSCNLLFRPQRGAAVLDQASITILAGTLAAEARELMRAEWDSSEGPHAQPHWHVYGSKVTETFQGLADETETDGTRLNLSRFHFAMSVRWMDPDGGHGVAVSGPGVTRWLPACAEYIGAQIKYLAEHAAHLHLI